MRIEGGADALRLLTESIQVSVLAVDPGAGAFRREADLEFGDERRVILPVGVIAYT